MSVNLIEVLNAVGPGIVPAIPISLAVWRLRARKQPKPKLHDRSDRQPEKPKCAHPSPYLITLTSTRFDTDTLSKHLRAKLQTARALNLQDLQEVRFYGNLAAESHRVEAEGRADRIPHHFQTSEAEMSWSKMEMASLKASVENNGHVIATLADLMSHCEKEVAKHQVAEAQGLETFSIPRHQAC